MAGTGRVGGPLLGAGDIVGVVAPGFAVRRTHLRRGVRALEAMGYRVRTGEHVLARHGYLAGTDEQRGEDLARMLRDPDVRAVWFARGGYGTARLLDRVPWTALRRRPKLLIGYSDLTALFAGAIRRGAVCLYGPVVAELGDPAHYHKPSLAAALRGREVRVRFPRRAVLRGGRAEGPLVGGNLTVLSHLLGTRHAPDLRGALLLLEEVGEQAYCIDRLLWHLRSSGALGRVRGIVIGSFDGPARRRFPPDLPLSDVLRETLLPLEVPLVAGLPFGHVAGKRTLPLGGRATLDAERGVLRAWPSR